MEILGLVGILVAIIAIITMAVKGLNIVIAAPLATLIIILTNQMDIFGSLVGKEQSYMVGLSNFLISNFAIFLLGSILAQYMEKVMRPFQSPTSSCPKSVWKILTWCWLPSPQSERS